MIAATRARRQGPRGEAERGGGHPHGPPLSQTHPPRATSSAGAVAPPKGSSPPKPLPRPPPLHPRCPALTRCAAGPGRRAPSAPAPAPAPPAAAAAPPRGGAAAFGGAAAELEAAGGPCGAVRGRPALQVAAGASSAPAPLAASPGDAPQRPRGMLREGRLRVLGCETGCACNKFNDKKLKSPHPSPFCRSPRPWRGCWMWL